MEKYLLLVDIWLKGTVISHFAHTCRNAFPSQYIYFELHDNEKRQ